MGGPDWVQSWVNVSMRKVTWMRPIILILAVVLLPRQLPADDIVINEILYHPEEKVVPEEFIELYNASDKEVDLSGWFFSDGVGFTFPEGVKAAARLADWAPRGNPDRG